MRNYRWVKQHEVQSFPQNRTIHYSLFYRFGDDYTHMLCFLGTETPSNFRSLEMASLLVDANDGTAVPPVFGKA
jgi:hypothetical protein